MIKKILQTQVGLYFHQTLANFGRPMSDDCLLFAALLEVFYTGIRLQCLAIA